MIIFSKIVNQLALKFKLKAEIGEKPMVHHLIGCASVVILIVNVYTLPTI